MRKLLGLFLGLVLIALFVGCNIEQDSNRVLERKQEMMMKEANAQTGMPGIHNYTERKMMKMILELRDQTNLVNYAYMVSDFNGKLIYIGRCIGYGLPYATQYTNPEKAENYTSGMTLPQADPNGLFMPASAEGTWLMLVDPDDGKPKPVYFEPRVVVSPFKLEVK